MKQFSVQFTSTSEILAVEALSKSLKKGASVRVTSLKETKMNKGRGANTNPFIGRVMERTTIGGWVVGTNYARSCQNAAERSGSDEQFEGKSNWHTRYNDFFETDKATGKKFYLQLQKSAKSGCKTEKMYFVDGKPATDAEVKEISVWLPKKNNTQSSSQVEAGINEEYQRDYILVTLSNIDTIEQGEFKYQLVNKAAAV